MVVDVWTAPLDAVDSALVAATLDRSERARAARFRDRRHGARWAAARTFVRHILAERLGVRPVEVAFGAAPGGKPALVPSSTLRFNLAHSGPRAVLAVADGVEVGVDVEVVAPVGDIVGVARRALPADVAEAIAATSPQRRLAAFHRAWVRHEAATKCAGTGITEPDATPSLSGIQVRDLEVGPGLVAAIAVRDGPAFLVRHRSWTAPIRQPMRPCNAR